MPSGTTRTMPIITTYSFSEIVLVALPFTDQVGSKKHPAVVISSTSYSRQRLEVILMAVINQVRRAPGFGEVVIQES
jgi:mRNA-degrading endonuclease toxin of MazEF toxin-antitoxin module